MSREELLAPLDGEAVGRLLLAAGLIDESQLREALIRRRKRLADRSASLRSRAAMGEGL